MEVDELRNQLEIFQRNRDEAYAAMHRCDGAIAFCRHLIEKMESDQDEGSRPEAENSD